MFDDVGLSAVVAAVLSKTAPAASGQEHVTGSEGGVAHAAAWDQCLFFGMPGLRLGRVLESGRQEFKAAPEAARLMSSAVVKGWHCCLLPRSRWLAVRRGMLRSAFEQFIAKGAVMLAICRPGTRIEGAGVSNSGHVSRYCERSR
jgi:hypothetical protein